MRHSMLTQLMLAFVFLAMFHSQSWSQDNGISPVVPVNEAIADKNLDVKTLAVLDLELTGDLSDSTRDAEWAKRLALMSEILRNGLRDSQLYQVVDHASAPKLVAELKQTRYLHTCNGCELDIARRLGAERVLVGWVFRMSNLILTLHIEIRDVASGRTVVKKALDFRGDNDKAWAQAISYYIKSIKERPRGSL